MHDAVKRFLKQIIAEFPDAFFEGAKIIECGSFDINGSPRDLILKAGEYIGIDWREGKGVDSVCLCGEYDGKPDGYFDLAISTETFEHDPYWEDSLAMMIRKLKIGGSLLITCAGPNRPKHHAQDSPTGAYYSNLQLAIINKFIVRKAGFEQVIKSEGRDGHDIYIFAHKKVNNRDYPSDHLFQHLIKTRGFKRVAEIGVASGNLAGRVLSTCKSVQKYYAVDPWKVYIESYHRPPHAKEKQQSWWDSLYDRVKGMEEKFPALEVQRMKSVDCARKFVLENFEKLDCVYIDAIHDEENIVKDLASWIVMIRDGGVIAGHDYIKSYKSMSVALNKIFQDDLNVMVIDPMRPALSHHNTFQGGNWWVEYKEQKLAIYCRRMAEIFPQHIEKLNAEWQGIN